MSPDGKYVAIVAHGQTASHIEVRRLSDGGLAMTIPLMNPRSGRTAWSAGGKTLLFVDSPGADIGFPGAMGRVYEQDFEPGRDTSASRRPVLDYLKQGGVETFGTSPDGNRLVYSVLEMSSSLMQAEGIGNR